MGSEAGVAGRSGLPERVPRHSFLLRVWWEPGGPPTAGEWRGTLVHVPTSLNRSFRGIERLPELIDEVITGIEQG